MTIGNQSLNLWIEDLYNDQVGLRLRARDCLHSSASPFQRIAIYGTPAFGKVLVLGGAIALTENDETAYSEMLVHPALHAAKDAKRVLIVGGGDGGVCREVLRHTNVQHVTVVELDQQVVEVCRKHFPASAAALADKRVQLVIDDAHRWLRACGDRFDAIIVDASELENPASDAFNPVPFAQTVFARLGEGGVLAAPLGNPWFGADACRTMLRTLAERFPRPLVYTVALPSAPGGLLAVALCGAPPAVTPAALPWHRALRVWHPGLQAALGVLPGDLRQALGTD